MGELSERTYRLKGDLIRERIKELKLTAKAVAEQIEVTPKTLRTWITGKERAYPDNAMALAKALKLRTQDLLEGFEAVQPVRSAGGTVSFTYSDSHATPEDMIQLCHLLQNAIGEYERYKANKEKGVEVWFVPGENKYGERTYFYCITPVEMHDKFLYYITEIKTEIPDFAVVVEIGIGDPSREVKARIKEDYGFDHDYLLWLQEKQSRELPE